MWGGLSRPLPASFWAIRQQPFIWNAWLQRMLWTLSPRFWFPRKLPCSSWTGNATLWLEKAYFMASYKGQVVCRKGRGCSDAQAFLLFSGSQAVRISHFLPCWQSQDEPPLICDSPVGALMVRFHCGSDTVRSGSQISGWLSGWAEHGFLAIPLSSLRVTCDKVGLFEPCINLFYWMFLSSDWSLPHYLYNP